MNLYAFVKNSPIFQIDSCGLWAWPWEDIEDTLSFETWSDNYVERSPRGISAGKTDATISVENVACECFMDNGFRKWRFSSAKVRLSIKVYLYSDEFYRRRKIDPAVARSYELDHVADYRDWSENEGDDIVEDFSYVHPNDEELNCVICSADALSNLLENSLVNARNKTVKKWDKSGKHDIKIH